MSRSLPVSRSLPMLVKLSIAALAVTAAGGVAAAPAQAAANPTCNVTGCDEAAGSNQTWASLGYPSTRGWYDWPPTGTCNYAGGTYNNYEGELPAGDSYLEFDVTPRECGAARQAYRIVLDKTTGTVYFSPDHYSTFYVLD